jgi:hypothetical protein
MGTNKTFVEGNATGQFTESKAVPKVSGVESATPTSVTGIEDAMMDKADRKTAPKPGFDILI